MSEKEKNDRLVILIELYQILLKSNNKEADRVLVVIMDLLHRK